MAAEAPRIFYGWWIVAAGTVTYALGYGARYGFAVIFPSLVEEFGWSRDTTATVLSSHMLVYGLVAPVVGGLVDRLGARFTMGLGALVLGLGLALSALGESPWHFWLSFGLLFGTGLCLVGAVPFAMVLRNWFEKRRGLAFSMLYLGSGGSYAWYPAVAWAIENWGWRTAFLGEGILLTGVILPLLVLVVRQRPEDRGLCKDGTHVLGGPELPLHRSEQGSLARPLRNLPDWTLGQALKARSFWLMCLATFSLWGLMQHILMAHNVAFAVDMGIPRMRVSSILSLVGVAYLAGALLAPISDRIGREATITLATLTGSCGVLALVLMRQGSWEGLLYIHALAFGFGNGLGSPTIAAAVTDLFQGPRVGPVIGSIWLCFAIGGCIGPWLGGWLFEVTGNYRWAFLMGMAWYVIACLAVWGAAPRKAKTAPP
jgi:MFS family permease